MNTRCTDRLAIVGGSGYLGSHIAAWATAHGIENDPLHSVRVQSMAGDTAGESADDWERDNPQSFERLCASLAPYDVVVNAAGIARPGATDVAQLFAGNSVQPAVVARAARVAGVRRLVHLSTAAVQGRLEPLDETPRWCPLSPYAESKAEAERFLLGAGAVTPPELVVYRPTSVHGVSRPTTRNLARLAARLPFVPVAGSGDRPVPVSLIENVAAGVVFAATADDTPTILLQPWEGMTTRRVLQLFDARIVSVPPNLMCAALGTVARLVLPFPRFTSKLRRLELVVSGQAMCAERLHALGFQRPIGPEGWEKLAMEERLEASRTRTKPTHGFAGSSL